jgi:hypothetical protein
MTALHFACRYGHVPALVQVLLTYTVDLVVDTQGKTALDYARQAGHDDILKVLKAEKEFEEYFGHELPGALVVEGTVARSEIENAEDPNVTIASQTSSGLVADDRVEQLKLEVLALKEQVRRKQIQFFDLSRTYMTLREQQKEMQNVQQKCEDLSVDLACSQEQMSALKNSFSELEASERKLQWEIQQHQGSQKNEADKAQQHLQKSLKEQKEKLEQRLTLTRSEGAGALETAQRLHQKEITELRTNLQRYQDEFSKAVHTIFGLRKELQAAHTLEEELDAASTLAAVSAVEQLPGLRDAELRELEEAVRNEHMRRQQLTLDCEREEMRRTMRAELERERAIQREEREEAIQCAICLDRDKDTALNCGHQACAICASELANCHICRKPIITWTRLY